MAQDDPAEHGGAKAAGDGPTAVGPLLLALTPALLLFILLLRPIQDVDIFWQLRLGEMTLHTGGLVAREPFAAAHAGEALAPLAWLGQVVFAKIRLLGGWTALRVFDAVVWLGGFWAVALACRQRSLAPLAITIAFALGVLACLPAASVRPQSFSVLAFGLLLALVRLELRPALTLLIAAPLLVLWQNLHPSVSVAAVVVGAMAAVAWLRRFLGRQDARPWLLSALAGLAAAATFATPMGLSVLAVSAANARSSIDLGVSEWLPIWAPLNRHFLLSDFLPAVLIAGGLLVRGRRRIDWRDATPALVLFLLTLTTARFVLFWGVALVPLLAAALSPAEPDRATIPGEPFAAPVAAALAASLALALFPTRFDPSLPMEGVRRLQETGVKGTVFGFFPWGGPLIDAGYPDWKVAYDGRYYRYTPTEWRRYRAVVRGEIGPAELDRLYHPAAYLLSQEADGKLIAALRAAPRDWREVYADRLCVAFVRNGAQAAAPAGLMPPRRSPAS